jgi:hypothetical protein
MNDLVVVQKIAGWEKLKALVLDSVSSPITKRVYNMALDELLVTVIVRWTARRALSTQNHGVRCKRADSKNDCALFRRRRSPGKPRLLSLQAGL